MDGVDSISSEKDKGKSATMQAEGSKKGVFNYTFSAVDRPFAFRVFAADTYSSSIKVMVDTVPRIKESQFHVSPPAYTGLRQVSSIGPPETLSGLVDSQVIVDVKLDKQAKDCGGRHRIKRLSLKMLMVSGVRKRS